MTWVIPLMSTRSAYLGGLSRQSAAIANCIWSIVLPAALEPRKSGRGRHQNLIRKAVKSLFNGSVCPNRSPPEESGRAVKKICLYWILGGVDPGSFQSTIVWYLFENRLVKRRALSLGGKDIMKLLLTSAGITNKSIHDTLTEMLGKPISEASALCIPTANHAQSNGTERAWVFVSGNEPRTPMIELGWKSMGLLELTALPSIERDYWVSAVQDTDVLLVNGGDTMYLYYWMRESGLADLLPAWNGVYVGLSAGSLIMTPRIGNEFVRWKPPTGGDETLGIVPFAIFPHLDNESLPENTMAHAIKWAAGMPLPVYAIDDLTAIKVVDGTVDVISEGLWKLFNS
jgi:dipeptidase E